MAIYTDDLPYLVTQMRRVNLPKSDSTNRVGYGNLVFLLTPDIGKSIHMINDKTNCFPTTNYYFYYNLLYRGRIGTKRYNIKNIEDRKRIYARIQKETNSIPVIQTSLDKVVNRNCYFDLSKYAEIFSYCTLNMTPSRKVKLFWDYFKSIINGAQTVKYNKKMILIDADMYTNFSTSIRESIDNPLFILYYTLYKYFDIIKDFDIDFVIYCKNSVLKVNPSKCDEKSYRLVKTNLRRVFARKTLLDSIDDKDLEEEHQKELLKESLTSRYNFVGDNESEEEITDLTKPIKSNKSEISKVIDKKVDEKISEVKNDVKSIAPGSDTTSKEVTDFIKTKSEMDLDEDKEVIDNLYKAMQTKKVPTKPLSTVRDAQLRERQENLKLGNISFKDINKMNVSSREIPVKDVSNSIHNINESMKTVKYTNMNKDYIENVLPQDLAKTFTSLNDKQFKFYIRDIKIKDSSDELNYKDTYTVIVEDDKKKRHTLSVDIPKFLDNKFLYLGGNKKIINRQNFLYPVVKTAPDTVQIVTNYNKMFIRRLGSKSISSVDRLTKLISSNEELQKYFIQGNNSDVNKLFITTIEYDELSKVFTKFTTENCSILFNQQDASDYVTKNNIKIPNNNMFIGIRNNKPIFINTDTQLTDKDETICDIIISQLPEEIKIAFSKTRSTKKLMYNTVTIMTQTIPFIVLLLFWEGITSVFNKIGLKYYFSERYPSSTKTNEYVIRFKDCYFVYEADLATSLLMNGIKLLDTENYNMEDYNNKEPYIDFFKKVYGKATIMNAINNYYEFTIDPITKEILEDINLPTDLIELCIYASSLLADESYTPENSQVLSRVRSTEIIPAILYNELSRAYLTYTNSVGKRSLSIPRDCVIKQLLALQTVEDYSTLNPVVEVEKDRAITSKGFRGINVDRAYTEEKRSYHDSMIGVMSMNTSPDGNVGINRFLTMEPNIKNVRGYVDIKSDDRNSLKDVNVFSPGELLYPLGNTRDDSIRTAIN